MKKEQEHNVIVDGGATANAVRVQEMEACWRINNDDTMKK